MSLPRMQLCEQFRNGDWRLCISVPKRTLPNLKELCWATVIYDHP